MTRYLLRNITLLNLVLAAVLALLGRSLLVPLPEPEISLSTPPAKTEKPAAAESGESTAAPSVFDYLVTAQQNLFHPERLLPAEPKDEKPLPKPEFVLYGVLLDGDTKLAFMEDLKALVSTPGRGRRQQVVPLNSRISGFTLKEIQADRVMLTRGEEEMTVKLSDGENKRSGAAQTAAAPAAAASPAVSQQPQASSGTTASIGSSQHVPAPARQVYRPSNQDDLRQRFRSIKSK